MMYHNSSTTIGAFINSIQRSYLMCNLSKPRNAKHPIFKEKILVGLRSFAGACSGAVRTRYTKISRVVPTIWIFIKSILSHDFFGGRRSSAGSRLVALLLWSSLLSAALRSSRLLWLWSPHLTGPLGKFYLTSWIAVSAEKLLRGPVSCGDQSQRRREDRRAALRRQKKAGARYGR